MIIIARLGGYLNRKCDGPPGFECLWKGYVLFDAKVSFLHLLQTSAGKLPRAIRRRKFLGQAQG
jgi:hypothetical protein